MTRLAIPDPSLVALIGAAGAGKSTFAARHFPAEAILSSDAFRAAASPRGSAADQGVTRAAFGRLHRALERRLAEGRLTVVDATNVQFAARRALVARARAAGLPAIAIVLAPPGHVVQARNAGRPDRVVPADVVGHHLARIDALLAAGITEGLRLEGFAGVHVVGAAGDEIVRIVPAGRHAPPGTPGPLG